MKDPPLHSAHAVVQLLAGEGYNPGDTRAVLDQWLLALLRSTASRGELGDIEYYFSNADIAELRSILDSLR